MSARLRAIARQTEEAVAAGSYRGPHGRVVPIAAAVEAARAGTRMYGPGPIGVPAGGPAAFATGFAGTSFEVTGESSTQAAERLTGEGAQGPSGPVAVLNFASARNPGGGYLRGAQAQEEDLCRASALYACLLRVREFYDHHRAHPDPFYSDRVIHSPAVPVFRGGRGELLDVPYTAGFLTAAAPNASVVLRTAPERADELPRALAVRAERVLETAAAEGYRRLVLGAWGCGVFGNDPAQVAAAFRDLLVGGRFEGFFDQVVFGVLDRTPGAATRTVFERTFATAVQGHGNAPPIG
ncbi:TIGR02452 family protein [Streptomyces sp. NPDC051639]|uniref:TIGR02452 family protein n=1 Tax=Streptomyces sp. NPDC051639 TaxID=3155671 RepID=UPI003446128D